VPAGVVAKEMSKEKLFSVTKADLRVDVFRCGGKGGQNVNKVSSGVRVVHIPSGASGEGRDERDQLQNKKLAFKRMQESKTFQNWLRVEIARRMGTLDRIEREIDADMLKTKVESKDANGRWVPGITETEDPL
jgi:protein subunit release factor A